jgi:hypothetical protein
MSRSFYLYQDKNGVYRAEILDPATGLRIVTRSTKTKNRDEAAATAGTWAREGIPSTKQGRKPRALGDAVDLAGILRAVKKAPLDADGAAQIAGALQARGLLDFPTVRAGPGKVDFITYLHDFWDFDESPYVKERLAHHHSIGRRYTYEAGKRVGRLFSSL